MPFIKCVICNSEIKDLKSSYQTKVTKSIVCELCVKKYNKKDLELLTDLFLIYGGFEGKLKGEKKSFDDILNSLVERLNNFNHKENIDQIFTFVMHHFLVNGVDLNKLKESLDIF